MVTTWLDFLKTITSAYWGNYGYCVLFCVACVSILFIEKDKLKRIPFLWFSLIVMILVYNPLTIKVCQRLFYQNSFQGYYLKLFNILPVIFVMVYGLTLLVGKTEGIKKFLATGILMAVMLLVGTTVYRQPWFTRAENAEKVPSTIVELSEAFSDQAKEGKAVHIMVPLDLSVYLRQYDTNFYQVYSREEPDGISEELSAENPDVESVYEFMMANFIDYAVVYNRDTTLEAFEKDSHFEKSATLTHYSVYKAQMPKWVLTDYTDDSGDQGMCYLLRNTEDGTLIVFDGGSYEMGDMLHADIKRLGGLVDTWVISHYHSDHVNAFNRIFGQYKDIQVKNVWDSPLDYDYFLTIAYEWDETDCYEKYLQITADWDNVNHAYRGQKITVDKDVEITFLNTYDDMTLEYGAEDIGNNCALVVKVVIDGKSFILTSDCHSETMGKMLMEEFGEELKADILQAAHHGNNSIPETTGFYELVDPDIVIFDAPEWLMTGERYTASSLRDYLEKQGRTVKWYDRERHAYGF